MKNLDYSEYAATQEKNRKKASEIMQRWVDANGVSDRQKVIEFAKALSDKYGEGAAAYACDMYDAVAKEQKAKVKQAIPADTASWEEVGRAINGSLKQSEDGKLISGVVERLVKQAGEDTMLRNAARDSAEFAWIPGGKACAFCIMLASRGWQFATKNLQNSHAEHIHANCNCEFAIRFDKNTNVKGYDPKALKKMYDEAAPGKNSNEKIKALRSIIQSEEENSNKERKSLIESTLVNMDYIKSNEFRRKLDELFPNVDERRSIEAAINDMLEHRTGTYYEDLAFIKPNGDYIINKDFDYYNPNDGVSMCKPNKPMYELLRNSDEYTIIGAHNHPKSLAPSINDLKIAGERKYKYGVVACHDSHVYKYTVSSEFNDEFNANIALAKIETAIYNDDKKSVTDAINDLKKLGVIIEVR